ncbi:Type I phosphodiesterase/nucleotide pyrophosphatase [uncultured Desulfobacterium sp.]|uniref:Type I phosphodiesterase/nucleotide pyrophosphatase n=1 Tax=uncultured Desulfobacterium sp. TaxID=201089 RepID=A0A445MR51_9BACT|nr:Type I phosphodiesterase/nucleotide pyrophosphatase [uncultured Desulfobacterium sp.]
MNKKRVIVIDVPGLSLNHVMSKGLMAHSNSLMSNGHVYRMRTVFPAVTLPVQASLTTGVSPEEHGVVSNGFYFPDSHQISFWEQAASLVEAERIWDRLKRRDAGIKTATLFFQNTLYAQCDAVITPRPMHTDEGLIQWCYSKPVGLYEEICSSIGEFDLTHYWGPMASIKSSQWISKASIEVAARIKPDLMFVYLPHLDYCMQKLGPDHPGVEMELSLVDNEIGRIVQGVNDLGLEGETIFIILSEYVFSGVAGDIAINRILRENGLLSVRSIKGREYLDLELSPAFAMADHQIAHIYIKPGREKSVRQVLEKTDGIDYVLDADGKKDHKIAHPRSGDIIAVSAKDRWFSYYWWFDREKEPDFAAHVDIHRKPGYDPLELFIEPGTFKISQDTSLIRGSHGYPAISQDQMTVLLISGHIPDRIKVPDGPVITDVSGVIETILTGD